MASNKNSPQKGQGAEDPDRKQQTPSDAADVDWMIISDISTRIGLPSQPKQEVKEDPKQFSSPSSSQAFSQQAIDDVEDIEWLRSLGLDEEIERSPSQKNTSNSQNSNVDNIDWLIFTDLKTRMDDSDDKSKTHPTSQDIGQFNTTLQSPLQSDSLDNIFDDDLGLDGLDFLENSDFSDLDSLEFTNTSGDLILNELQDEIDITEGRIRELTGSLSDEQHSGDATHDIDLDAILGVAEDISNSFTEQPSLEIIDESVDSPFQTTQTPNFGYTENEDYDPNVDIIAEQLPVSTYQEDLQDDFFNENLELSEEFQADSEFQDTFQAAQDVFASEKINDLVEGFDNELNDEFGTLQPLDSLDSSAPSDEIWASNLPSIESEVSDTSNDDAFASNWEQMNESAIDDAVWDSPSSNFPEVSSTSIENAFGTLDDWAIAPQTEALALENSASFDFHSGEIIEQSYEAEFNSLESEQAFEYIANELEDKVTNDIEWSSESEALSIADAESDNNEAWSANLEIANTPDGTLEAEIEIIADADISSGIADDLQWNPEGEVERFVDAETGEEADWSAGLEAEIGNEAEWNLEPEYEVSIESEIAGEADWNVGLEDEIAETQNSEWHEELVESEYQTDVPLKITNEFLDISESNLLEESLHENFNFIDNLDDNDWVIADIPINEIVEPNSVNFDESQAHDSLKDISNNLGVFEQIVEQSQSSEWENFDESIAEQMTDSDFADTFSKYAVKIPPSALDSQTPFSEETNGSEVPMTDSFDDLEGIIDENFDLASFNEDSSLEVPLINSSSKNFTTSLTPSRVEPVPPTHTLASEFTAPQLPKPNPTNSPIQPIDHFEDALANELLNDSFALEEDFIEAALVNDLLNGSASESDSLNKNVSDREVSFHPSQNLSSSSQFDMDTNERDFLDDFDLDAHITGEHFDSAFSSSAISTGLTPPSPSISPIISSVTQPEPTSPSINNPPPPPPFLPPLPPKRNSSPKASNSPSVPNVTDHPQSKNRITEDDFDSFHVQSAQSKNRKPMNSIDESWSELLDADTVLSGVLKPPMDSPYSDTNSAMPPKIGVSTGGASAGRISQAGRERPTGQSAPKRKETGLPDFNDLGLEIHDDNTDWSGLLDSGDLSDSITSISTQMSSRGRNGAMQSPRTDMSGVSETRQIPRDRRKPMPSFGDATQARMAATPDQMDFNRFTEDNYGSYGNEPSPSPASPVPPKKPKLTMPNVSLESLWQNYLKIPVIGLGVVGGVFLLYTLLSRPIFDLGLRWGLFKDASGKDFTNADFKGAKLDNVDFSKAILTGAKMQDASLIGANFQDANIDGVNFANANLSRARLIKASVIWAEFGKAQMNLVDLAGADLTHSNFANAKMEGVNLKGSKIGAQGTEKATIFSSTMLLSWQIVNEPKEGRNLAEQNLSALNLSFTSLKRANMSNAKLNYTDLTGTDLSGANLSGGQLNGANLSGAKLTGINLTGVEFDQTKLPKTDEETVCPNGKKGPCKF